MSRKQRGEAQKEVDAVGFALHANVVIDAGHLALNMRRFVTHRWNLVCARELHGGVEPVSEILQYRRAICNRFLGL